MTVKQTIFIKSNILLIVYGFSWYFMTQTSKCMIKGPVPDLFLLTDKLVSCGANSFLIFFPTNVCYYNTLKDKTNVILLIEKSHL